MSVLTHPTSLAAGRVQFAHPSERVLAALLDVHEVPWEYEPVEFALAWSSEGRPTWGFRPDFWLPDEGCFVELTTAEQPLLTRKHAKIRRFRQLYPALELFMVYRRDFYDLLDRLDLRPLPAFDIV